MRSRLAALTRWSKEDPKPHADMMRAKFDERFEREVDPDGVLPEAERIRRAVAARKAHFTKLALASSKARARKKK